MPTSELVTVLALAAAQHGVVSGTQVRALGMPRGRWRTAQRAGWLSPLYPNVFRVAGSPATWRQRAMAATLARTGGVLSHHSAAALHGLLPEPGRIDVNLPRGNQPGFEGVHVRLQRLRPDEQTQVDGISCTTIARTLADLARLLPAEEFVPLVEAAAAAGVSAVEVESISQRIRGGRSATAVRARQRLAWAEGRSLHWDCQLSERCQHAGLPVPVLSYQVCDERGEPVAKVPLAWPQLRLAVFCATARQLSRPERRLLEHSWVVAHLNSTQPAGLALPAVRALIVRLAAGPAPAQQAA